VKVTSTPVSSVKVTVRRTKSGSGGSTSSSQPLAARLSQQTSDVSDVSTTTTPPVTTPASADRDAKFHPLRGGLRQRHRDDDSSSCSSTEALNQNDVWNENPLYANQRRSGRRVRHIVDTGPLDDLLTQPQPSLQNVTRSSTELTGRRPVSPPGGHAANPPPPAPMPLQMSASVFKSEPDVTAAHNTLIIHDSSTGKLSAEFDVCHGSMLDCISVAAPDDTVIKPSQLRASMRQRRTPSLADDSTTSAESSKPAALATSKSFTKSSRL